MFRAMRQITFRRELVINEPLSDQMREFEVAAYNSNDRRDMSPIDEAHLPEFMTRYIVAARSYCQARILVYALERRHDKIILLKDSCPSSEPEPRVLRYLDTANNNDGHDWKVVPAA